MLQSFVGNASSEGRIEAIDLEAWQSLVDTMSYMQGDFDDPNLYATLRAHRHGLAQQQQTQGNELFYLAVVDRFFGPIIEHVGHGARHCRTTSRSAGAAW